jgi:hypothetical protein
MGARNLVKIGLSYRPARLHRLAGPIPGLLKSLKIPPGIDSKESIPPIYVAWQAGTISYRKG